MSDEEAHARFVAIRWSDNAGQPYCPECGCLKVYAYTTRIRAKKPRVRNTGYFTHGELSRRIYEALRAGADSVSAAELAEDAMKDKGLPADDRRLRATFLSRFLVRLDQMAEKGTIERIGAGSGVRWKLAAELDRGLL